MESDLPVSQLQDRLQIKMKICLDTTPLRDLNASRGVGKYTSELLQALQRLYPMDVFVTDPSDRSVDLVHYPFFDLFFHTLPLFSNKKSVVTIHDVIPLVFAKHYPLGYRGRIAHALQRLALRRVSHILTDSEASKRDIIDHLRIASEKITVVPLACSAAIQRPPQAVQDSVRKQFQLPKKFLLYVGDINYNKNLPFLITLMQQFPKLSLVLVGKAVKNTSIPEGRMIRDTILRCNLQERVHLVDTVQTSEELSALYSLSTAYIQPSLYEGFGLPVLEAMQCKTPVICSKGGSLPEVAGDGAIYFHPMNEDECVQAIKRALSLTAKERAVLIRKGLLQVGRFSWNRVATETMRVYERVGKF